MKDIKNTKSDHTFKFWKTQPVPNFDELITENTFIQPPIEKNQLRNEHYSLPEPFIWSDINILDNNELGELYLLLNENYVEDDENLFRFDYSKEFLKWAVLVPAWKQHYFCGVRAGHLGKLIAFISAIPAKIRVYDKIVEMVTINFLCVHKKLRTKRLAPVLIREITRRVNLDGIFQATFTSGIVIPKPVSACRYWHRSLNPKKLIETNFSHITHNMTLQRTLKLYKLPNKPNLTNLKPLNETNIQSAFKLVTNYLKKFKLSPEFSIEEFSYLFLPRKDVIYCYVIETNEEVTDFLSFYCLPSSVMHHPIHKTIKAAYSYYNVATTVSLTCLMQDALIIAKNEQFDVFNALDLMENKTFLQELKFGKGDGDLQYYLYNWKCPNFKSEEIGIVLQ